jgi:hypothetical protein
MFRQGRCNFSILLRMSGHVLGQIRDAKSHRELVLSAAERSRQIRMIPTDFGAELEVAEGCRLVNPSKNVLKKSP